MTQTRSLQKNLLQTRNCSQKGQESHTATRSISKKDGVDQPLSDGGVAVIKDVFATFHTNTTVSVWRLLKVMVQIVRRVVATDVFA